MKTISRSPSSLLTASSTDQSEFVNNFTNNHYNLSRLCLIVNTILGILPNPLRPLLIARNIFQNLVIIVPNVHQDLFIKIVITISLFSDQTQLSTPPWPTFSSSNLFLSSSGTVYRSFLRLLLSILYALVYISTNNHLHITILSIHILSIYLVYRASPVILYIKWYTLRILQHLFVYCCISTISTLQDILLLQDTLHIFICLCCFILQSSTRLLWQTPFTLVPTTYIFLFGVRELTSISADCSTVTYFSRKSFFWLYPMNNWASPFTKSQVKFIFTTTADVIIQVKP